MERRRQGHPKEVNSYVYRKDINRARQEARQAVERNRELNHKRQNAAVFLQSVFRGQRSRKITNKMTKDRREYRAAVLVQTRWRIYRAKIALDQRVYYVSMLRIRAIEWLNAATHGWRVRRKTKHILGPKRLDRAAAKIQAGFRGKQGRVRAAQVRARRTK